MSDVPHRAIKYGYSWINMHAIRGHTTGHARGVEDDARGVERDERGGMVRASHRGPGS
jgi:hypothetical protein